jgi:hypothetical protein
MDFAQNFTFVTQEEIQSAYYSRQQATLFTIYIKIGNEHRNMVIISDYLPHDTRFVYCGQRIIMEFLKKEYRNVFKINYVTDGATGHFKSMYSIFQTTNYIRSFLFHQIDTIFIT